VIAPPRRIPIWDAEGIINEVMKPLVYQTELTRGVRNWLATTVKRLVRETCRATRDRMAPTRHLVSTDMSVRPGDLWASIWRPLIISITLLVAPAIAEAATAWNGPKVVFTKANGANSSQAANQDRITSNVWLTRGSNQGIYNAARESSFSHSVSPADTEWATGTTANYASLSYTDWETWSRSVGNPPSTPGVNAVLHLKTDDIYIDIKFLSWSERTGGGMSYERSTVTIAVPSSYLLSITTAGSGTVTSTPAGLSCGNTCSATFSGGTSIVLTATPASGFTFGGWSGACSGTGACTLTLEAAANVTAIFTSPSPTADCLFNWAERSFPHFFAPAGAASLTLTGTAFYYRSYPDTGNYLATNSADNHLYALGVATGGSLLDLGPMTDFISVAGCAH